MKDILFHFIQWTHWIRLQLESKYVADNWNMLEWKQKFKISRLSRVSAKYIQNMMFKIGIFRLSSVTRLTVYSYTLCVSEGITQKYFYSGMF